MHRWSGASVGDLVGAALLSLLLLLWVSIPTGYAEENQASAAPQQPVTLRVALYPYVPERRALFLELQQQFQADHPGVSVQLVESTMLDGKPISLVDDYYSGGIERAEADIYEIDTILLADMVAKGRLSPVTLPFDDFAPETVKAVTENDVPFAVPHWRCGNFLFYRKGNSDFAGAKTWGELVAAAKRNDQSIFVDLKGKSNLGEWYLTAAASSMGLDAAEKYILSGQPPDAATVAVLAAMLETCPKGFCRNQELHDRGGYYARAFVRGEAAAYVGYSESIHDGLQDAMEDCLDSKCLTSGDIEVRPLPAFGPKDADGRLGWVDGLAIDAKLDQSKKDLALTFIRFLVSNEAYMMVLEPESNYEAPRYLLPARTDLKIDQAPLYDQFLAAEGVRKTGKDLGLNNALRAMGKRLDSALPSN
jgi:thiamine pyridinylase